MIRKNVGVGIIKIGKISERKIKETKIEMFNKRDSHAWSV